MQIERVCAAASTLGSALVKMVEDYGVLGGGESETRFLPGDTYVHTPIEENTYQLLASGFSMLLEHNPDFADGTITYTTNQGFVIDELALAKDVRKKSPS